MAKQQKHPQRYAVITGANKGIGYEIARQLAARGVQVILTARDREKGLLAAKSLGVYFVQLDVTDEQSVAHAVEAIRSITPRVDFLVNNAGVLLEGLDGDVFDATFSLLEKTFATNVWGVVLVTRALKPLLHTNSRIVNVSSRAGQLSDHNHFAPLYSLSKTALNKVTCIFAQEFAPMAVNSMCPGWVRTDMGTSDAPKSVETGADTVVWLCLEAPEDLTGKFVAERKVIPW